MDYSIEKEILAHLQGIVDNVERMTSGNFMHNKNAIKLSAEIVRHRLEKFGIGKSLVEEYLATQERVHALRDEITSTTKKWFEKNKKSFKSDTYYGGEWGINNENTIWMTISQWIDGEEYYKTIEVPIEDILNTANV